MPNLIPRRRHAPCAAQQPAAALGDVDAAVVREAEGLVLPLGRAAAHEAEQDEPRRAPAQQLWTRRVRLVRDGGGGWTRRVQSVREGRVGGGGARSLQG